MIFSLRQAGRSLATRPGYVAMAVSALALGVACSTVMFSFVRGILLTPLSYPNAGRIVTLLHDGSYPVSPSDFLDWKRQARSFRQMEAAVAWSATLEGSEGVEHVPGLQVTPGMFTLLGERAALGRTFTDSEASAVVLSHGFWQRRYGGRAEAIGQSLRLNGEVYTVIGVMPRDFRFAPFWVTNAEMWVPVDPSRLPDNRNARMLRVFGLLTDEATLRSAQAEMDGICRQLATAYPDSNAGLTVTAQPLNEKVTGPVRKPLLALLGAVALLMLLTCSNIASLMLARGLERRKEMSIRVALGAGRGAIAGQLLAEAVLLAAAGGAAGIAIAVPALAAARALIGQAMALPKIQHVGIDPLVLAFAVGVSAAAGILAGLVPAWQTSQVETNSVLKDAARGASEGRGSARLRSLLVCGETALCVMLLAGAGVLVSSYLALRNVGAGFETDRLLTMTISLAGHPDSVGERRDSYYDRVVETARSTPGVISASMVNHLPAGGDTWGTRIAAEGAALPRPGEEIGAVYRVARPGYFETLRAKFAAGRDFTRYDGPQSTRVAIVNQAAAEKLWPGANDVVGRRLTLDDPRKGSAEWVQVVGVVRNIRHQDWATDPGPEVFLPYLQTGAQRNSTGAASAMTLVVRTASDPGALAEPVRRAVASLNRGVPVSQVRTFEQILDTLFAGPRFALILTSTFAALALLLASLGLFGVMSYSVRSRSGEIGIRMALGASRQHILTMVLRQGLGIAATGGVVGLLGAALVADSASAFVYGVRPLDPASFAAALAVMLLVALGAIAGPALRAASVDPASLRGD